MTARNLSNPEPKAGRTMAKKMKLPPVNEIESEVSKTGTGAHVFVPKDWIGKKVKVTVVEDPRKK